MFSLRIIIVAAWCVANACGSCSSFNNCNGHGICSLASKCVCFEGWGSDSDITTYRAPDCSAKVCPAGSSWGDLALRNGEAHQPAECSDKGVCNRKTGKCKCAAGYEGAACQRRTCPNNCSGHGRCVTMERMASTADAMPISGTTTYQSSNSSAAWDSLKIVGCVCESSWAVGFGANQTQEAEWFGPDCSFRHCPSADNPRTMQNETDCEKPNLYSNRTRGEPGNLCQVDCANQGICDHSTGTCLCFEGMYGPDCATQLEGVPVKFTSPDGIYAIQPGPTSGDASYNTDNGDGSDFSSYDTV